MSLSGGPVWKAFSSSWSSSTSSNSLVLPHKSNGISNSRVVSIPTSAIRIRRDRVINIMKVVVEAKRYEQLCVFSLENFHWNSPICTEYPNMVSNGFGCAWRISYDDCNKQIWNLFETNWHWWQSINQHPLQVGYGVLLQLFWSAYFHGVAKTAAN